MSSAIRRTLIIQLVVLNSLTISARLKAGDGVERLDFVRQNEDGLLIIVCDKDAIKMMRYGHSYDIEEVFDDWIFPDSGYKRTNDPRTQRTLLGIALSVQVEQTCQTYQFNQQHKQKLYLSGQGDIAKYFDRLERLKVQFRQSIERGGDVEVEALKSGKELRETYRQFPFRQSGSLYSKVLQQTLISERRSPQPLSLLDSRGSHKAFDDLKLYEVCADLVEQHLAVEAPLRDKQQRIQLAEMLKRELHLTQIISRERPEMAWRKMAELSESAWKSRLDQAQWEILSGKFREIRRVPHNE